MSHWEDLERLFTAIYLKEIDQEENVWRSLPFFSATLAVEVVVLNQTLPVAAEIRGALWWVLAVAGISLSMMIVSVLMFLFRSIRRQSFSYIASGRDLVAYVRQLEIADPPADAADPMPSVRERLRETLIGQLAAAADANRLINQSRAAERTRAGILLLASILTTIMFVGVTLGHGVGSKLQQDIGHDPGDREAITQQGSPSAAGDGRDPAATGAGSAPQDAGGE